jgi:selenide,water dikinase
VKRNDRARPGDVLILGKPLGVGILSAALKKGELSQAGYQKMLEATTRLNTPGMALAEMQAVHAMTDVTGFGLAGHLMEICRGSRVAARVRFSDLPFIAEALEWARKGTATGASGRNWAGYGHEVELPRSFADWQRNLLTDPQTSGGLLVACAPAAADEVLALFRREGFAEAVCVGELVEGTPGIAVD